jgi:hypothetical protein
VALANLMRLSLLKAAHADAVECHVAGNPGRPSCSTHVRKHANMGHPSRGLGLRGNPGSVLGELDHTRMLRRSSKANLILSEGTACIQSTHYLHPKPDSLANLDSSEL